MSLAPVASVLPTIIVDDEAPTDAALVDTLGGHRVLVLRPLQSFSNAVTQITQLLPAMHPDQVRAVVRAYLPESADFDGIESTWRGAVEPRIQLTPVDEGATRRRRLMRKVVTHASVWSVVTLAALGYVVAAHEVAPYESAPFKQFADRGRLMCDPIDNLHARCVDIDGAVMFSTVMTSPDHTLFSFSYGQQKIAMRVFPDTVSAAAWESAGGNHEMYDNITRSGRYVFYGTDAPRVATYAALVGDGAAKAISGGSERVMGLAMGALNLPPTNRIQLVSMTQESALLDVLGEPKQKRSVKVTSEVPVTADYLAAPRNEEHQRHRSQEQASPTRDAEPTPVKTAEPKPAPSTATPIPRPAPTTSIPTPVPAPTTAPPVATTVEPTPEAAFPTAPEVLRKAEPAPASESGVVAPEEPIATTLEQAAA